MRFTTGWARRQAENWPEWVKTLKGGDRVLYQEFVPRGTSCMDSQVECWRFWDATICHYPNRVRYNNDIAPIEDGLAIYWDSDFPKGEVFAERIVPFHHDLFDEGRRFVIGHAPIYEPEWDQAQRCFVLVPWGPEVDKTRNQIRKTFVRSYARKVDQGQLMTIFAYQEDVSIHQTILDGKAKFLYSENTWD